MPGIAAPFIWGRNDVEFVTDRTGEDLALGREKGCYGIQDLNRVENNTAALRQKIREMGEACPHVETKGDWALPGAFSPEQWPVKSQMERYLQNVGQICRAYHLDPQLPASMEGLTWEGANQIEQALQNLDQYIKNTQHGFPRCGGTEAGGNG